MRPPTVDDAIVGVRTAGTTGEGLVLGCDARAGATGGGGSAGGGVAGGGSVTTPRVVRVGAGGGVVATPSASGSGPRGVGAGGGGVAALSTSGSGPRGGFVKPVFRTLDVNVPRGADLSRADLVAHFVSEGLLSSIEAVVMTRFGHQVTFTSHGVMAQFSGELVVGGGVSCPVRPVAEMGQVGRVRWVEPFLTLRLHWLPYFVSVEAISAMLAPYGKVLWVSVGHVNGLDHLPNGVRLVRLEEGGGSSEGASPGPGGV